MEISILYEDDNVIALNKPSGLIIHPDGRGNEKTLVDWINENYPLIKDVGEDLELDSGQIIKKPGIVHRLDRETTGVILVAKNQDSFLNLKLQFQNREINKTYHAFVYGKFKEIEGEINRPISKSRKDFRMWSAQRLGRGKERDAVTFYKVLAYVDDVSLIEVTPKTGRTHQIRVHFKAINHPVVCDKLYAPKREHLLGFQRLALHSYFVEFSDLNSKKIMIKAPYPDDFKKALSYFK